MAKRIIQALHDLSKALGVHIVTPEYELLLALLSEGALSAERLFEHSSRSRAGFFHVVSRLKQYNLIVCAANASDKRRRVYCLAPAASEMLFSKFRVLRQVHEQLGRAGDLLAEPHTAARAELNSLLAHLPRLTCEYQILLALFLRPGATTNEIEGPVTASTTKFYACLEKLVELNIVRREISPEDGRIRRFFLQPAAEAAIARAHQLVLSWLDELT